MAIRRASKKAAGSKAVGLPPDPDTPVDDGPGQLDSVMIDPATNELVPKV